MRAQVAYLRSEADDLAARARAPAQRARRRARSSARAARTSTPRCSPTGCIDELFLTTVPALAGAAGALSIMDGAALEAPVGLTLRWMLEHEGELFARYGVGNARGEAAG